MASFPALTFKQLGVQNSLGMAFDPITSILYAVESGGIEPLNSASFNGADVSNTNPSEEVNEITLGTFYGFPACWSGGNFTTRFLQDPIRAKQYVFE